MGPSRGRIASHSSVPKRGVAGKKIGRRQHSTADQQTKGIRIRYDRGDLLRSVHQIGAKTEKRGKKKGKKKKNRKKGKKKEGKKKGRPTPSEHQSNNPPVKLLQRWPKEKNTRPEKGYCTLKDPIRNNQRGPGDRCRARHWTNNGMPEVHNDMSGRKYNWPRWGFTGPHSRIMKDL